MSKMEFHNSDPNAPQLLPCSQGCGCQTEQLVDGKPVCIFCEDGVPCPAAKNKPPAPAPAANPAPKPKKKKSMVYIPKKPPMKKCKAAGCETLTASKVGYCSKHFYMSKLVNPPGNAAAKARSKAAAFRPAPRSTTKKTLPDLTTVQLSEAQIDTLLTSFPLEKKIRLWLAGLRND